MKESSCLWIVAIVIALPIAFLGASIFYFSCLCKKQVKKSNMIFDEDDIDDMNYPDDDWECMSDWLKEEDKQNMEAHKNESV